VGTDIEDAALDAANTHTCRSHLANVSLVRDDLFATALDPASFDLVHARFMLAPLGRANEQLAAYRRLLKPRGWLILEEPDSATWRHDPPAPAAHRLTGLVRRAFHDSGGNFDAGTELIELADGALPNTTLRARTLTLPPGHPYALAPLSLAGSLRDRLRLLADPGDLQRLQAAARDELAHPRRWTITFTLMQLYGRIAGSGMAR
jgi:SAM-dependent methyltransferase